jgi:peptidoglycan/LPS O-acetylase OafA/YrhL
MAVLLVAIYYGFPTEFHDGQIGVDSFFVISGYLIVGLIVDDTKLLFPLSSFCTRRIHRVLPVLISVISRLDCLTVI